MKKSTCYCSDRAAAEFVDCVGEAMKEDFVKDILNTPYYSILTDGSTDASILEQEVLYVLFLSSSGVPVLEFLSVDTPQHAHADGLKQCIEDSFQHIGITPLSSRLASMDVDGAAVNTGIHSGLGVKFKETTPWTSVIHCFNHCLELAVKDMFNGTFFKGIDTMLVKLYYLYKKVQND